MDKFVRIGDRVVNAADVIQAELRYEVIVEPWARNARYVICVLYRTVGNRVVWRAEEEGVQGKPEGERVFNAFCLALLDGKAATDDGKP